MELYPCILTQYHSREGAAVYSHPGALGDNC